MTNASIKNTFAILSVLAVSTVLSMGAFAIVAHAQEDLGYGNTYGDNLGYADTYGTNLGYGDTYGTNLGYADTGNTYGTDMYGTDVTYENGIGYSYNDYGTGYSSNYGSSYGGSSFGGGSTGGGFSFGAPATSYSNPIVYQQQQQQQQQQIRTITTPGNTTNTSNYCTNNSCNYNNTTNISNSGNTNVTTVSPVRSGSAQFSVQYVYPQQNYNYQTYNTVSCYISSSQNYLSWAASGATSAWLSGVGSVSPTGSIAVPAGTGMTYTLTVSGPGGSNTCSTYVAAPIYNVGTSVSLSQIPYTGFDFGPIGNALYWLSLLAFAAAGAYLLVYYRGGMALLATSTVARTTSSVAKAPARIVKSTAQKIEKAIAAEPSTLANLPVMPSALATVDSMSVAHSKDGSAPRLIITRS